MKSVCFTPSKQGLVNQVLKMSFHCYQVASLLKIKSWPVLSGVVDSVSVGVQGKDVFEFPSHKYYVHWFRGLA